MTTTMMTDLFERAGWALLHSLWQVTVVALALALAMRLVGRERARLRCALATVALAVSLGSFLVTLAWPSLHVVEPRVHIDRVAVLDGIDTQPHLATGVRSGGQRGSASDIVLVDEAGEAEAGGTAWLPVVTHWVTVIWIVGMIVLTVWNFQGWRRARSLRRSAVAIDCPEVVACIEKVATALELRVAPCVRLCHEIASPAVSGVLRPLVLIPSSLLKRVSTEQLELILAHEFAHLKRLDPLLNHLQAVAETVLFFHPAVWWISRQIRHEREFACDAIVVASSGERAGYVRALAAVQEHAAGIVAARGVLAATGVKGTLMERLERILGQPTKTSGDRAATPLMGTLVTAVALASLGIGATGQENSTAGNERHEPLHPDGVRGTIFDHHGTPLAVSESATERGYPLGALGAHVIGFTSKDQPGENGFQLTGRTHIEQSADEYLRRGDDVYLTIDARIQLIAEQALKKIGRGAAVVIDPQTGDVRALASVPSFDPNLFTPRITQDDFYALRDEPSLPLFNRAALGLYPPASTFKIVTAVALHRSGLGGETLRCDGGHTIGNRRLHCWIREKGGHGALTLEEALICSCNDYFYQAATKLGIDEINRAARDLGLGQTTGIELASEPEGALDGPGALGEGEEWGEASAAIASIGHGRNAVTPLQLASATATVANGKRVRLTLIDRVVENATGDVIAAEPRPLQNPTELDLEILAALRKAMSRVVNDASGTARSARSSKTTIAGKTGTAQNRRGGRTEYDAWFTGFAPFDEPELVVTIIVEHGRSGGASAAPIAKKIFEEALAISQEVAAPSEPVAPHPGHLEKVGTVSFDSP